MQVKDTDFSNILLCDWVKALNGGIIQGALINILRHKNQWNAVGLWPFLLQNNSVTLYRLSPPSLSALSLSLLTRHSVQDYRHCAHALVSNGDGASVLTLLLSRKSICYHMKWLQCSSSHTQQSRKTEVSCRGSSIFHPFCVLLSELRCANLPSPNIVKGVTLSHPCITVMFFSVSVHSSERLHECSEVERQNDNARSLDNILRR